MTRSLNSSSTRPTLAPGTYRIDPARSRVAFAVKELFGLKTARGTFTVRDGTVVVGAGPATSTAWAELDAASFTTDKAKRDEMVTGRRFLDAQAHPAIGFRSTRIAQVDGNWQLTGLLTVRGAATEVVLHLVDGVATPDGCRFTATARIDRHATPVRTARGMIARYLDVEFDIRAVASSVAS